MKEVEELSFDDSATGASERKRHLWVGKLIAVLIVVALVVVCASAWAWEARLRHISVFVNGRHAEISVGTTAKQLLKDHDDFGAHPGRLLAVDGVTPSNDTLADGSYPLCNDFYAVIHPDAAADSPERILYDWLDTDAGQDCIKKSGYVAVGPQTTVTIVD